MRNSLIVLAAMVLFSFDNRAIADDSPPSAELKVLEDMIGAWDEVMTNKATEWTPKAGRSTTVTKRSWSLGGKFIRGEGSWQPDKSDFLHLMSYDPDTKVYRSWYFDASGAMPRGSVAGVWNATTKTMTWTGTDESGNKTVSTQKIIDKDHNDWAMIVTNPDGKVVLDFTGKCTRRKE